MAPYCFCTAALTVRDSLLRPLVTKLKPWVSIATPVRWMCSSTYLTKKKKEKALAKRNLPQTIQRCTDGRETFVSKSVLSTVQTKSIKTI